MKHIIKTLSILSLFGLISCSEQEKVVNANQAEVAYHLKVSKKNSSSLTAAEMVNQQLHLTDRILVYADKGEAAFPTLSKQEVEEYKNPNVQSVTTRAICKVGSETTEFDTIIMGEKFYVFEVLPALAQLTFSEEVNCNLSVRSQFVSGSTDSVEINFKLRHEPYYKSEKVFTYVGQDQLNNYLSGPTTKVICKNQNKDLLRKEEILQASDFICRINKASGQSNLVLRDSYRLINAKLNWNLHVGTSDEEAPSGKNSSIKPKTLVTLELENSSDEAILLKVPQFWGNMTYHYGVNQYNRDIYSGIAKFSFQTPIQIRSSNIESIDTGETRLYRLQAGESLHLKLGNNCEIANPNLSSEVSKMVQFQISDVKIALQLEKYKDYEYMFLEPDTAAIKQELRKHEKSGNISMASKFYFEYKVGKNCQVVK